MGNHCRPIIDRDRISILGKGIFLVLRTSLRTTLPKTLLIRARFMIVLAAMPAVGSPVLPAREKERCDAILAMVTGTPSVGTVAAKASLVKPEPRSGTLHVASAEDLVNTVILPPGVTDVRGEVPRFRTMTKSIMSRAGAVPLRERYRVRRVGLVVK